MQIWQELKHVTLEPIKSEMKKPVAYSVMPGKLKAKVWYREKTNL